jgi:spore maturation protein CgeB
VTVFEHYQYHLPGRLRARMDWLQRWEVRRLNRALVRTVESVRPDLLLVLGGVTIWPETLADIRRRSISTAAWFGDYPTHFEYTMTVAPQYDHFFVSDSMSRDRHAAAGHRNVQWLPFGCMPEWAEGEAAPASNGGSGADDNAVVFVGSWYPEREEFLARLGGQLAIWGPGWPAHATRPPVRDALRGGPLRPNEWRRRYRRALATLNLHYGFGGDPAAYGAMANTRVFEVLAAGGFLVSDEKKDLVALFRPGQEFVGFHDVNDCQDKIRYYRDHPAERRAIVERGQRAALAHHTYEQRLRRLLEIAGGGV